MTTQELAILIAVLQVADAASTIYFLKHTNMVEMNPLLRWAFEKFGAVPSLLVAKGAFVAAIWYWLDAVPVEMLWVIVVVYVAVVWNNIRLIRRAKSPV